MAAIGEVMPREADRLGKFSWAMFDWANQPFFTVVTTFIFAPYFTSFVAATPAEGQAYWGYTQAIAGALIAILSPVFGSIADAGGARKPWILFFSTLCAIGAFSLWWAVPGIDSGIFWILAGSSSVLSSITPCCQVSFLPRKWAG